MSKYEKSDREENSAVIGWEHKHKKSLLSPLAEINF
jgi:hypothetical protein